MHLCPEATQKKWCVILTACCFFTGQCSESRMNMPPHTLRVDMSSQPHFLICSLFWNPGVWCRKLMKTQSITVHPCPCGRSDSPEKVLFFRHVNSTLMGNWRAVGSHIAERSAWEPWPNSYGHTLTSDSVAPLSIWCSWSASQQIPGIVLCTTDAGTFCDLVGINMPWSQNCPKFGRHRYCVNGSPAGLAFHRWRFQTAHPINGERAWPILTCISYMAIYQWSWLVDWRSM